MPDQKSPFPSFDDIYREHFAFVWRSLCRLGIGEGSVDDASQDVFLVVHRRLGDFEGRSSIRTWLFGIAVRVAKDYRRRSRRKPTSSLEELPSCGNVSPASALESRRAAALLHRLLQQIDEKKRAVFILAELEEMTGREIAEALSIPVDTVYSRLRAARHEFERSVRRSSAQRGDSSFLCAARSVGRQST